jgi:hypothetical protein
MSLALYKVGIVVDRLFGNRIVDVARSFHVWVVESLDNMSAIQQVWESNLSDSKSDPLGPGVTTFVASEEETPEAICARIVYDVEAHHGEFAHEPAWSEIEVFGVKLSPALKKVFEEIGATAFESTQDGFICCRSTDLPMNEDAGHWRKS